MKTPRMARAVAGAAFAAGLLVGCGSDGEPPAGELRADLIDTGYSEAEADCIIARAGADAEQAIGVTSEEDANELSVEVYQAVVDCGLEATFGEASETLSGDDDEVEPTFEESGSTLER